MSSPPAPTDSTIFLGCYFPSSVLTPPHQQSFIVLSIFLFSPVPHFLSRCESPPTWMLPTPATCQPPPLVSAPLSAWLRIPPFIVTVHSPPFSAIGLRPGPCRPLGGLTVKSPLVSPVSMPCPPWVLLWILASSGSWFLVGWFFARGKEARATRSYYELGCHFPNPTRNDKVPP